MFLHQLTTLPKESKTGVIDLQDVDPKVVEKMIEFFYKGQYSTDCRRRVDKAIFHAKMFATAEMYNASGLQTAALDRFSSAFSDCWNYELPFVIEFALTCVPAHVEDLRTEVVSSLDRRRSWLKTPSICTVVKTFDLTYDLLKRAYLPGPEFEDSDDE
jgi:hypothetical protein